jgi:hypothetical protein
VAEVVVVIPETPDKGVRYLMALAALAEVLSTFIVVAEVLVVIPETAAMLDIVTALNQQMALEVVGLVVVRHLSITGPAVAVAE